MLGYQLPANHTLYVNNLNDKISVETLKKSLNEVFAAFGEIMDIVAMKSLKRRGQAWIIFNDIAAATSAMKSLQGFPFYNQGLQIAFAKTKSDVVAKADDTFVERPRRTLKQDPTQKTKKNQVAPMAIPGQSTHLPVAPVPMPGAIAAPVAPAIESPPHDDMLPQLDTEMPERPEMPLMPQMPALLEMPQMPLPPLSAVPEVPGMPTVPNFQSFSALPPMPAMPDLNTTSLPGLLPMPGMPGMHGMPSMPGIPGMLSMPGMPDMSSFIPPVAGMDPAALFNAAPALNIEPAPAEPNKTLFVDNIPEEANDTMLSMLFRQYPGFIEVRLIQSRNVAFVDYNDERQSELALQGLDGFQVNSTTQLKVTYARK
eukprot:GEMP01029577.1.p1 GENE.GEMP01029577.1~~GEMP01029577.1.p1  ORF type:complete len:380 (+),score=81.86 GEMP01029577.1:32-1141(+)